MKENKKIIHSLVADGQTEDAINFLSELLNGTDKELYKLTLLQSAKYKELKKAELSGTKSNEELNVIRAKINNSILEISEQLKFQDNIQKQPSRNKSQSNKSTLIFVIIIISVASIIGLTNQGNLIHSLKDYFTNPIVLIGFTIFLFFTLLRVLINSGIIPPLEKSQGGKITTLLIRYGFYISMAVIILGFGYTALKEVLNSNNNTQLEREPELYITLTDKDNTEWEYGGKLNNEVKYPLESTTFESFLPTFDDPCTLNEETDITEFKTSKSIHILNRGEKIAENIWIKIFLDSRINVFAIGIPGWKYGYDDEREMHVIDYDGDELDIPGQSVISGDVILSFFVPMIPRTYSAKYVIGGDGIKLQEREIDLIVKTEDVPFEFIEYAKGIEFLNYSDLTNSLKHFKIATEINPSCGVFFFTTGTTLMNLNRYDEALKYAIKAAELLDDDYRAWGNLGICYYQNGEYQLALEAVEKALNIYPESPNDLKNYRIILNKLEELKNADNNVQNGNSG